jgi:hypothetical protein
MDEVTGILKYMKKHRSHSDEVLVKMVVNVLPILNLTEVVRQPEEQ